MLTRSRVRIISGNGATCNTCEGMFGRLGCKTSPSHCNKPNKYAPNAARSGFHPPKMVMAKAIQPKPSKPEMVPFQPALTLSE